jgi:hypothetical protein
LLSKLDILVPRARCFSVEARSFGT